MSFCVSRTCGWSEGLLTRVLDCSPNAQFEGDIAASGNLKDLRLAGIGEGPLVTPGVGALVDVGVIANIDGRVGRELDGVVPGRAGEVPDVAEAWGRSAVYNDGVKEVMGRCHLGSSGEDDS